MNPKILHIDTIDQINKFTRKTMCGKNVRLIEIAKRADDSNCPQCQAAWKAYQELHI